MALHLKLRAPADAHAAAPAADAAAVDPNARETGFGLAGSAAAEASAVEDHSPEEGSTPPSETHERLVSLLTSPAGRPAGQCSESNAFSTEKAPHRPQFVVQNGHPRTLDRGPPLASHNTSAVI
jgi:hypothetical protein